MSEWVLRLLNLPEQASSAAPAIDALHVFVIATTMLGATGVGLAALAFLVRYRRSRRDTRYRPGARARPVTEAVVIAGLLGLFVLWWWIGYRIYLEAVTPPERAHDVYVTAKQWMWKFAYPSGRETIGLLVVPAGEPVALHLTSRDVIHSLYVPAFRLKHDAVPGAYATMWFEADRPGAYQLLCAEYCGLSHSQMRGRVVVLPPEDYADWLAGARAVVERPEPAAAAEGFRPPVAYTAERATLAERGRQVAARHGCLSCHTLDGQEHVGPSWYGRFGEVVPLAGGGAVLVDERYLTESMMDPGAKVAAGYEDVMPAYQGLLRPVETAAIVELIRSLQDDPAEQAPPLPPVAPEAEGRDG